MNKIRSITLILTLLQSLCCGIAYAMETETDIIGKDVFQFMKTVPGAIRNMPPMLLALKGKTSDIYDVLTFLAWINHASSMERKMDSLITEVHMNNQLLQRVLMETSKKA